MKTKNLTIAAMNSNINDNGIYHIIYLIMKRFLSTFIKIID